MKVFPSETSEIYHWDSVNQLLAVVHATCFRCQKYEHQINPYYPSFLSYPIYPSSSLPCARSCLLLEKLKILLIKKFVSFRVNVVTKIKWKYILFYAIDIRSTYLYSLHQSILILICYNYLNGKWNTCGFVKMISCYQSLFTSILQLLSTHFQTSLKYVTCRRQLYQFSTQVRILCDISIKSRVLDLHVSNS